MTKRRPFGITVLAIFVGIAAVVAVFHTLQFLHLMPFSLGPIRFFAFDWLGALLWGINSLILIWVTSSLWNLRQEGRLFVLVIAIFNLILAIMSVIGQSTLQAMLPAILINLIILIYCLTPNVEAAFKEVKQPAPAAAAPMAAAPAARAAAVPPPAPVVSAPVVEAPVAAVSAAAVMAVAATEETAVVEEPAAVEPEVAAPVMMEEALAEPEAAAPVMDEVVAEPEAAAVEAEAVEAEDPAPAPAPRPKVPIETIEGIGPTYGAKLKEIGILVVADLLDERRKPQGSGRAGRKDRHFRRPDPQMGQHGRPDAHLRDRRGIQRAARSRRCGYGKRAAQSRPREPLPGDAECQFTTPAGAANTAPLRSAVLGGTSQNP